MNASVEISYYPLTENYEDEVITFIQKVQEVESLEVRVNSMSTHIFGEYDLLMKTVSEAMKESAESQKGMFVMKVAGTDLSEDVPDEW